MNRFKIDTSDILLNFTFRYRFSVFGHGKFINLYYFGENVWMKETVIALIKSKIKL